MNIEIQYGNSWICKGFKTLTACASSAPFNLFLAMFSQILVIYQEE